MKLSPADCLSRHEGVRVGKEGSILSLAPRAPLNQMQHLSRFDRIAYDGSVERIDQIAHERVAVYRFQRLALARLALALGLDRGGIAANFPDHDPERDRPAEMLLQRDAKLVLIHLFRQMPV